MQKNTSRLAKFAKASVGLAACVAATVTAFALITFDPATGIGFVGKGDVQLVYGWNNGALQQNAASVKFRANTTTVIETSWMCLNENNQQTQERTRTTTTETAGVVTTIARERNQITGFNLNGYIGGATTTTTETEGPPLESCPNPNSTFHIEGSTVTTDPVVIGGGLEVSIDNTNWFPISNPVL
jgi:hypothetical protein